MRGVIIIIITALGAMQCNQIRQNVHSLYSADTGRGDPDLRLDD